jgi:hypothetical protein
MRKLIVVTLTFSFSGVAFAEAPEVRCESNDTLAVQQPEKPYTVTARHGCERVRAKRIFSRPAQRFRSRSQRLRLTDDHQSCILRRGLDRQRPYANRSNEAA